MERECRNCGELRNKFICDVCKQRRLEKDGAVLSKIGRNFICSACNERADHCDDACGNDYEYGQSIICWKGLHFCSETCKEDFKKLVLKEKEVVI